MDTFLEKTFYHNTIMEWAISLGIVLGAIIIARSLYWFIGKVLKKRTVKSKTKLDDILVDMLEEPLVLAIVIIGLWWAFHRLDFPVLALDWSVKIFHVLIAINITWFIARVVDSLIREYLIPITDKSESDFDDQLMPILQKGVRSIIWIIGIIVALNNAGYNVGALIAGLGIGGLALAMAAKDTVANIFGGLTVFIDKPFTINDRVKIGGYDGTVIEIGIRSSRIKTLEGRIVTVPNHKFTDSFVENVSVEPSRKMVLELGLTYNTSTDAIENAMMLLHKINDENKNTTNKPVIGFTAFGDFSLGVKYIYYIKKGADIMQTNTAINLAILKAFNEANLNFAFPTQTIVTEN